MREKCYTVKHYVWDKKKHSYENNTQNSEILIVTLGDEKVIIMVNNNCKILSHTMRY